MSVWCVPTEVANSVSKRSLTSECFSGKFSRTVKMKESFRRIGISVLNSIPHFIFSNTKILNSEITNKGTTLDVAVTMRR